MQDREDKQKDKNECEGSVKISLSKNQKRRQKLRKNMEQRPEGQDAQESGDQLMAAIQSLIMNLPVSEVDDAKPANLPNKAIPPSSVSKDSSSKMESTTTQSSNSSIQSVGPTKGQPSSVVSTSITKPPPNRPNKAQQQKSCSSDSTLSTKSSNSSIYTDGLSKGQPSSVASTSKTDPPSKAQSQVNSNQVKANNGNQTQAKNGYQTKAKNGNQTQAKNGNQTQAKNGNQTQAKNGNQTQAKNGNQAQSKNGNQTQARKKKKNDEIDILVQRVQQLFAECANQPPDEKFCYSLVELLQPPDKLMYDKYLRVREDFKRTIHDKLSFYDIHPFGSTVSGLAFRDSDFDIYVKTNLNRDNMKHFLYVICDVMKRHRTFEEFVVLGKARIPLIKAVHVSTGSKVDFSFGEHYFGVQNTYTVKYLSMFDPRIKPLTLLLKYWFRANGFSGTGKFTNYCMFMMIVYYLQIKPNPILPPLIDFQRDIPANEMGGWNVAFNFNRTFPNQNQNGVFQLMFGFFEFYAKFNFRSLIICPLFACVYDRDTFHTTAVYPEQDRYYKYILRNPEEKLRMKLPACVQDPFTMNINIATCSEHIFNLFVQHTQTMVEMFSKRKVLPIQSVSELSEFFTCRAVKKKPAFGNKLTHQLKYIAKQMELDVLQKKLGETVEPATLRHEWTMRMVDYVQQILVKFMALNVVEVAEVDSPEHGGPSKSPRHDGQMDVHDTGNPNKILRTFKVTATKNVFHARTAMSPNLAPEMFIAQETAMVAKLIKQNEKQPMGAMLTVSVSSNADMSAVIVTFSEPQDIAPTPGVTEPSRRTIKEFKMLFNFLAQAMKVYMSKMFILY